MDPTGPSRPGHPYDEGRAPRRAWPRRVRLLTTAVVVVGLLATAWGALYWRNLSLADVPGEPRRWADRTTLTVTRVDGGCDHLRGRYRQPEDRCPATWEATDGTRVDGLVSDGFGSTMPAVGETVVARPTTTDGDTLVVSTRFGGPLAARHASPAQSASDPLIGLGVGFVLMSPVLGGLLWWNRRLRRRAVSAPRPPATSSR
ncbi:hypothetical protein GCM10009737_37100 [Nocardioides lentus]|uniref:DUF3592 domain-containing protein n=1 Tax=Nocardioides lentus TaxID=338077 RepID=A0ABN2PU62_9ACTN